MKLTELQSLFANAGCTKLYAKPLSENDNSKNQVYFGPGFDAVNLFPNEGVLADTKVSQPNFKAKLKFGWLQSNGQVARVPSANLILYPQYPEVRFSGFLRGCQSAPSELMAHRIQGRVLFLGITDTREIVGLVVAGVSQEAKEFHASVTSPTHGIFFELGLPNVLNYAETRKKLLFELNRIHTLGWIDSKQLDSAGVLKPCNASNCGGLTLEAEFGIPKNSKTEPDYLGWELKQYAVKDFKKLELSTAITLLTPEPTGGIYKQQGLEAFIRRFGYPDKNGIPDRINIGGTHKVNARCSATGLTMKLNGFDLVSQKITNPSGAVELISDADEIAAKWDFSEFFQHWSHKHSKAVYVPCKIEKIPHRQYSYGNFVRLAEKTDPLKLLAALASGAVYYDPGIKLENASLPRPTIKRRSQFRVTAKNIKSLYQTVETVSVA